MRSRQNISNNNIIRKLTLGRFIDHWHDNMAFAAKTSH